MADLPTSSSPAQPTEGAAPAPHGGAPDPQALRRQARRLAAQADPGWLNQEVGKRLADKLDWIKLTPESWLDWSAHLGASSAAVQARYPQARRWVVEPDAALRERSVQTLAAQAKPGWRTLWRTEVPQVWLPEQLATQAPWRDAGVQMLWANMVLHTHGDLPALMSQWQRQLAVGGFLMCSGLGPDTARELRALYASLGWSRPTIDFIDMHDLGDALVQAGFADPVMDMEKLTLTWETPEAMLDELRAWGGNVAWARHAGLRTPRWRARLRDALGAHLRRPDGRLGLTIELVYGHAIKPEPRPKVAAETRVSLQDMQRMVRRNGP
jgi:malonyl-CoA O-methyltransferase